MSEDFTGVPHGTDHAALMDEVYSFQRHLYDVTRPTFLFGRDRLLRGLDAPPGVTILEVGCGTARNLVKAASLWPGARLHGIDISAAMLETARASIARKGLSDRIEIRQGDAGDLDVERTFDLHQVDRILFSYTLSMMPPWRDALRRATASLAPGGSLHVVDFGQYDGLPGWLRDMHFAWMGTYHVSPRADLVDVLRQIADETGGRVEFESLCRGYAWHAVLHRSTATKDDRP